MSLKISPNISYNSADLEAPSYSLAKVLPLSGAQTAEVQPNNQYDITMELPVIGMNLARSYLYADVELPETTGVYTWEHKGIMPFQSVALFTRGGSYLCNLTDKANFYSRVVMTAETQDDEFRHADSVVEPIYVSNTAAGSQPTPGYANVGGSKSFQEQVYAKSHDTRAGAVNARWLLPLRCLKKTIFDIDKTLLFREILVLKISLAKGRDIFWTGSDAVNTDAGVLAYPNNYKLTNVALYLAQERSASIMEALNQQTQSAEGMSILVDFPSTFVNSRSGSSQNVSLRLNRSHGQAVKSLKYCVFENEVNNLLYCRDNNGGRLIPNYYTLINNNRTTEFNIDVVRDEDWMLHRDRFKNTPVQNKFMYKYSWFAEDVFNNNDDKMSDMKTPDTNIISGINLNSEVRFDFYSTQANGNNSHYTIAHGIKVININDRGLVIG